LTTGKLRETDDSKEILRLFALVLTVEIIFFVKRSMDNLFGTILLVAVCVVYYFVMLKIVARNPQFILSVLKGILFYICVFGINYLLFANLRSHYVDNLNPLLLNLVIYVPCAVLLSRVNCFDELIPMLKPYAYFGLASLFFTLVTSTQLQISDEVSYQGFGLRVVICSTILFLNWLKTRNSIEFVIFLVSSVMILFGGRQTLLTFFAIVIFFFSKEMLLNKRTSTAEKASRIVALVALAAVFFVFGQTIVQMSASVMKSMGINSRNIDKLVSGEVLDGSNRDFIYDHSISLIKENGISVSGFFSDRQQLRYYRSNIAYAHNIFYEILLDFGLLLGVLISAYFIFVLVRGLLKGSSTKRDVVLWWTLIVMIRLWVSSSFLVDCNIILLLGLLFNKQTEAASETDENRELDCELKIIAN